MRAITAAPPRDLALIGRNGPAAFAHRTELIERNGAGDPSPQGGFVLRSLLGGFVALSLTACAEGPQAAFDAHAAPVLERSCTIGSGCHGVPAGEPLPELGFFVTVDDSGRLGDPVAARAAALTRVTTSAPPHLSSLVRIPLATAHAGGPHVGGDIFGSPDDPQAAALARWIDAEPDGTGGEDVLLTELETQFAEEVLPVLLERCAFSGCHGPSDVANTSFPARRDPSTGAVAPLEVRATRRALRKFLELTGADVRLSRLVRKAIGETSGGLRHRGGPSTFFPEAPPADPLDAPGLRAILRWATAERAALGIAEDRAPRGLLYVRGPIAERAPYRIEAGGAGSDLFLAPWPPGSGTPENLTATLHPEGPVEIREPAVAHDGRTIAFAMRRATERTFALYQLDADTRESRRLTPESASGSFVSPVFGPDGRLVAVWDGHGEPGTDGDGVPPELVAVAPDGTLERLTFTRAPEVRPAVLAAGKTRGMVIFSVRRSGPRGSEGVLFRFPPCHDPDRHGEPEYHVQFGASLVPMAPLVARELPDGRQVLVVLSSTGSRDDRGALFVLDRSLGPRLPDGAPPSIAFPVDPISVLDAAPRYRDPIALPDGRVLVATDTDRAQGEDALVAVTIVDGAGGATLGPTETWLAEAGASLRDPALLMAHPIEDDDHAAIVDPSLPWARIAIRSAPVLEAIYGRPEPYGARPLRSDLRAVRVLVPARTEGALPAPGARVLAEVPLAADGSAELHVPARTPVLLNWLDARGMVIGNQLDRWFYGEGGELVPAGANAATYAHACASCHGALSGDPSLSIAPAPDAISAASVTLSTHDGRDRRRPIPPADLTGLDPRSVTFEADVAPLVAALCVRCHGETDPAAGLALTSAPGARYPLAYESLVTFVDAGLRARRSPLVERLSGDELDAPGSPRGPCPPEGVDEDTLRLFCRWIESGSVYREVDGAR